MMALAELLRAMSSPPLAAMAATAFRTLRTSGPAAAQAHYVELAATLVIRDSTAARRRGTWLGPQGR